MVRYSELIVSGVIPFIIQIISFKSSKRALAALSKNPPQVRTALHSPVTVRTIWLGEIMEGDHQQVYNNCNCSTIIKRRRTFNILLKGGGSCACSAKHKDRAEVLRKLMVSRSNEDWLWIMNACPLLFSLGLKTLSYRRSKQGSGEGNSCFILSEV